MAIKKKSSSSAKKRNITLHIVSDSTGNSAQFILQSAITQFPELECKLVSHIFQDEPVKLERTLRALRGKKHLVFHALVDTEMKRVAHTICLDKGIPDFDLSGRLVQFIADHTSTAPVNELARLHNTDEGYFHRIEAMEFTAQHDDNRRIDTIGQADIVIVGLSRVSKSPTSTWLGSKGYKVANVALAKETGFPEELDKVMGKTVAFTCRPRDLFEIRKRRFEQFDKEIGDAGIDALPYYDLRSVVSEVSWVESEFRKRGYPIIDISDQTVEELAVRVLSDLGVERRGMTYQY